MFYQKMTREEKQRTYEKNIETRNKLENDPIVVAWKKWSNKPISDQISETNEWNDYFSKVKDTVIYAMYQKQREYALRGNYRGVKEIADQVREMRANNVHITLEQPDYTDPWEYRNSPSITAYLRAKEVIKDMSDYEVADEIFS